MDVKNRVAVITGGATGMGFAAGQALTAEGARVALLGRTEGILQEKAAKIGALAVRCDVSDEASVAAAFDTVEKKLGTASILINSAAEGRLWNLVAPGGVPVSGEYIREVFATNIFGVLYMARDFVARLSKTPPGADGLRGVVINVSSIAAADGGMGSAYSISKGAVDAAGLVLAREFDQFGVRVVTIAPGGINTELFRKGANEGTLEIMKSMVPSLRRAGRPDEFGRLALHICQNDYLNGVNIRLDGGMRAPFAAEAVGAGFKTE
jgi:NAD(P)-dependent dehydrogenase (short-subunit alcohol dehydrogenase family)